MAAQENKTIADTYYKAYNDGDLDFAAGLANEDVSVSLIGLRQRFEGIAAFKRYLLLIKKASSNAEITVVHQLVTDNAVVNEFTFRATHTGPLVTTEGEVPASGNTIEMHVCDVWEIKDGKISAIRSYFDSSTLVQQLGLASDTDVI